MGRPMVCVVRWSTVGSMIQSLRGQGRVWPYVDDIAAHAPFPELPRVVHVVGQGITQGLGGHLNTLSGQAVVAGLAPRVQECPGAEAMFSKLKRT